MTSNQTSTAIGAITWAQIDNVMRSGIAVHDAFLLLNKLRWIAIH